MSVGEVSRERVEERLVALDDAFDSFPVNQTTLTVSSDGYQQIRERCRESLVDAYVQVYNDDGQALLVGDGTVPQVEPAPEEGVVAGVRRALRDRTGVDVDLTGLERVTILGVCDETADDPDPVYRLVVVLAGERVSGTSGSDCEWSEGVPASALPAQ